MLMMLTGQGRSGPFQRVLVNTWEDGEVAGKHPMIFSISNKFLIV